MEAFPNSKSAMHLVGIKNYPRVFFPVCNYIMCRSRATVPGR